MASIDGTNAGAAGSAAPCISDEPIISLPYGVTVRCWRPSDAESCAHHANNRKVWLMLRDRFPYPYAVADATAWINISRGNDESVPDWGLASGPFEAPREKKPGSYAICVDDEAVGGVGLQFRGDVHLRTAEFGYWLGEEHWGKGIMTAVAREFARYTWATFGQLVRLDAHPHSNNPKSARVLEKAGFVFEGTSRCNVWKDGKMIDSWNYVLIRDGF